MNEQRPGDAGAFREQSWLAGRESQGEAKGRFMIAGVAVSYFSFGRSARVPHEIVPRRGEVTPLQRHHARRQVPSDLRQLGNAQARFHY